MKLKTKKTIEGREWDKVVAKTYNRPYNLQQQNSCMSRGNYSISVPSESPHDFDGRKSVPEIVNGEKTGVSFKAWLDRDPKQKLINQKHDYELELWWDRTFYPDVEMIANDLHALGLLDAGEYDIEIDW